MAAANAVAERTTMKWLRTNSIILFFAPFLLVFISSHHTVSTTDKKYVANIPFFATPLTPSINHQTKGDADTTSVDKF
jgi:hypothetical protein